MSLALTTPNQAPSNANARYQLAQDDDYIEKIDETSVTKDLTKSGRSSDPSTKRRLSPSRIPPVGQTKVEQPSGLAGLNEGSGAGLGVLPREKKVRAQSAKSKLGSIRAAARAAAANQAGTQPASRVTTMSPYQVNKKRGGNLYSQGLSPVEA